MAVILKVQSLNTCYGLRANSYAIVLSWIPQHIFDNDSKLVQLMAWCRQATSYYLNQCWPRSMSLYDITRPQWVKWNSQAASFFHSCHLSPHKSMRLTHWGRDKMDAISQTTLWNTFSWMKMWEFRAKFHWSLFLGVQLAISQHWFR